LHNLEIAWLRATPKKNFAIRTPLGLEVTTRVRLTLKHAKHRFKDNNNITIERLFSSSEELENWCGKGGRKYCHHVESPAVFDVPDG